MKVGILGGGQLGLMLARAAGDLDIEPLVLDPKPDAVAARAAAHLALDWDDDTALDALAGCDVAMIEAASKALSGMDSLLSIVQMPGGIPVGTLAIGRSGAINAALLAASIIATSDVAVRKRLEEWRAQQTADVLADPDPSRSKK